MKIKIAAIGISTVLTSLSTAYSNTYIGVNVGYANSLIKPKWEDGSTGDLIRRLNKFEGIPGGIHLGWERSASSKVFTAAEIGIDVLPQSKKKTISDSNSSGTYKVEKGFLAGFTLKAGYTFDKFIPYVGIGVMGTSWRQKFQVIQNGATLVRAKKSAFQLGGAPVGGIQVKFGHWITGIEYRYLIERKQNLRVDNNDNIDEVLTIKPRSHDVRARLSYAF